MQNTVKEFNSESIDDFNRYRVGVTQSSYNPAEREFENMLWLVAYDIANPKRLSRVAKTCLDYGVRVEKSVFECDLEEAVFATFWSELNALIEADEDAIVAYRICSSCVKEALSAGMLVRPETVLAYIL